MILLHFGPSCLAFHRDYLLRWSLGLFRTNVQGKNGAVDESTEETNVR